jgi:hypothetical protein
MRYVYLGQRAKKNNEIHFGYKVVVTIDHDNKLIRDYEVSCAEAHDSRIIIEW